jgi:hypothetical protein
MKRPIDFENLFYAFIVLDDGQLRKWEGLTYNQARWRYHWIKRELVRSLTGPRWKNYGYAKEGI